MPDRSGPGTVRNARLSLVVPRLLSDGTLWLLERAARHLATLGRSANAVSLLRAGIAVVGGVLLALGYSGPAALAMVAASLGDALDGLVARRTGCASVSGALLDASVDRYEEFFFIGGLAIFFRGAVVVLVLALAALAGSFMVSYGSAKAEALAKPAPPGAMRRPERAVCLCVGVGMVVPFRWLAHHFMLPAWLEHAPPVGALAVIAVVANVSAIRRLQSLGRTVAQPKTGAPQGYRHRTVT